MCPRGRRQDVKQTYPRTQESHGDQQKKRGSIILSFPFQRLSGAHLQTRARCSPAQTSPGFPQNLSWLQPENLSRTRDPVKCIVETPSSWQQQNVTDPAIHPTPPQVLLRLRVLQGTSSNLSPAQVDLRISIAFIWFQYPVSMETPGRHISSFPFGAPCFFSSCRPPLLDVG